MPDVRPEIVESLRRRFFSAVHLGLLAPGQRLPSIRELAQEYNVDRRKILTAYRALEREGLVELRERSGVFFAPGAPRTVTQVTALQVWSVDVLLEAARRGITVPKFLQFFSEHADTRDLRVACIECNDDQVAALCGEVRAEYGLETDAYDVDALLDDRTPGRTLARADLLMTTPFHAGEVQELAARAKKPWLAVTYRADVFAEIAQLLPAGPVFFVVTDPRFAKKVHRIYADLDPMHNLRLLLAGVDHIGVIPPGAPVYVSRTARGRLAGEPVLARVGSDMRTFSPESARALLTFLVSTNAQRVQRE
ncbi:MAG TPA: GntR family transcriptional regulator [Gemmatimonadaceae bacterium]|jgi:DNA-binding transcriptional regulator YhcF (GntR family)|nr:GntR family transcriptional regulator [Gemmatimonadaceae bacterium]